MVHNRSVPNRRTSTVCHTYRLADHKPGSTASAGSIFESTLPKTAMLLTHWPTSTSSPTHPSRNRTRGTAAPGDPSLWVGERLGHFLL